MTTTTLPKDTSFSSKLQNCGECIFQWERCRCQSINNSTDYELIRVCRVCHGDCGSWSEAHFECDGCNSCGIEYQKCAICVGKRIELKCLCDCAFGKAFERTRARRTQMALKMSLGRNGKREATKGKAMKVKTPPPTAAEIVGTDTVWMKPDYNELDSMDDEGEDNMQHHALCERERLDPKLAELITMEKVVLSEEESARRKRTKMMENIARYLAENASDSDSSD